MKKNTFEIKPYTDAFKKQVVDVWEKSVRATHGFLVPSDIDHYKKIVAVLDFNAFSVYCMVREDIVVGFIGVADRKIEMLFLSPEYLGQGLGRTLVNFAIKELDADKVDVNEQNLLAVKFYAGFGFEPYGRMEKDSEGKDYPILKMKLSTYHESIINSS
ncbi:GNAT family N-acetyltransferase [Negadavirga shengliensis]|uniref:GNAT family N-acetyltransferase n=1 Tax=Negadavirga shengliensis TaxID=1389218 RepID=A0ABV9SWE9_9BACT